jgi:hypothetical protein
MLVAKKYLNCEKNISLNRSMRVVALFMRKLPVKKKLDLNLKVWLGISLKIMQVFLDIFNF